MQEQRNLLLAIVISVAILLGYEFLFQKRGAPPPEAPPPETAQTSTESVPTIPTQQPAGAETAAPAAAAAAAAVAVAPGGPRIAIGSADGTGRLVGSLALTGGRIDDLVLSDYHETVDPESPPIRLFAPPGDPDSYFASFGWIATGEVAVPGPETVWQANRDHLEPGSEITLAWDNGQGLRFHRQVALDDAYMFTITQSVENTSDEPVTLYPFGLISRTGHPKLLGYYILHEGPLGVFDGTLREVDYKDVEEAGAIAVDSTGGWIGITDKYWLTALVPVPEAKMAARFLHTGPAAAGKLGGGKYQVDLRGEALEVAPGQSRANTVRLFAGAKVVSQLDRYEETLNIARFDRAVDFGWFYFLTKPLFYLLHYLGQYFGNFGLAILAVTVLIKLIFFPLANKSYAAMSKLKKLQPEMKRLRETFGDDKQRLNTEMMALYKREGANPLAGCLPIVVQIPVFFSLYKVLFVTLEMRHTPFYGWVHDLSARDPTSLFNLFGLVPWVPPDVLNIGVWPLAMGITMFLQQKLNPAPPDPVQAKVMMALPIVFTFMFARFPAGLVIYWTWNNVLSILQQWVIMRRMGAIK